MNHLDLRLEVVWSCQPLHHIRRWISQNRWFQRTTNIGNGLWEIKWLRNQGRHVTPKSRTRDPNSLRVQYNSKLKTAGERDSVPIPKDHNRKWHGVSKWSRDRWRHVTPILSDPNSRKNGWRQTLRRSDFVPKDHQSEMVYGYQNGHVTNDVAWPQRDKLMIPILSEPYLENG